MSEYNTMHPQLNLTTNMFSPVNHHQKSVASPPAFRNYVTRPALALPMLITLAVHGAGGGKQPAPHGAHPDALPIGRVGTPADHNRCRAERPIEARQPAPFTLWHPMTAAAHRINRAFHDPALIDYANQQGIGIP